MTCDVLILGAGIIGCAVAYETAKSGLSVAVLDRGRLGSGSTGAGGGFISVATKKPGPHLELARASAKIYETLAEELETSQEALGYRQSGCLIVAETAEHRPLLGDLKTRAEREGSPCQSLSASDLRRWEPEISPSVTAALLFPKDAEVLPMGALTAYRQAAERHVAAFYSDRAVEAATWTGENWRITAGHDSWEAPCVVIAAGASSGEVRRLFGIAVPVRPRKGQGLLLPPVSPLISHPMLSAGYFSAKHALDAEESPAASVELSLWQRADGRLFIGGTREWAGFDASADHLLLRSLRERAERVLPALRSAPAGTAICGFRPYSETGLPLIGPVPHSAGLFLATGHEGDGVSLAPITGQLLAQAILNEPLALDISPFLWKE